MAQVNENGCWKELFTFENEDCASAFLKECHFTFKQNKNIIYFKSYREPDKINDNEENFIMHQSERCLYFEKGYELNRPKV